MYFARFAARTVKNNSSQKAVNFMGCFRLFVLAERGGESGGKSSGFYRRTVPGADERKALERIDPGSRGCGGEDVFKGIISVI